MTRHNTPTISRRINALMTLAASTTLGDSSLCPCFQVMDEVTFTAAVVALPRLSCNLLGISHMNVSNHSHLQNYL